MIWQSFVASAVGATVTLALFFIGLRVWRRQLVAKRRFEVAEQAIAATIGAIEGISHIRQRMLWAGELAAVEVPTDVTGQDAQQLQQRGVYFARARLTEAAFAELRVAQILADIHINSEVVEAMDAIFKARQEVLAAASTLHDRGMEEEGLATDQRKELREMKVKLRRAIRESRGHDGKPEATDTIAARLDAAKATIETACRPFLR